MGLDNEYFYMFVSEDCSCGNSSTVCICKEEYLMISVHNKYLRADYYSANIVSGRLLFNADRKIC